MTKEFDSKLRDMLIVSITENKQLNMDVVKMKDYIQKLEDVVSLQKRLLSKTQNKYDAALTILKQNQEERYTSILKSR